MAYKVSYKVVTEQGEALKKTAKDMDNYISQLDQITSKLGNDELFQSVREQLKKFKQQLEEERTVLNLAGQIITEVVQSYTGAEKKSVQKVDKAKAHNRDFYKRPVAVASAGGATAAAAGTATASSTQVYQSVENISVTNTTVINQAPEPAVSSGATVIPDAAVAAGSTPSTGAGLGAGNMAAAAATFVAAAGAGIVGAAAVKTINATGENKKDLDPGVSCE